MGPDVSVPVLTFVMLLMGDKRGEGAFVGFLDFVLADAVMGEVIADNRPSPSVEAFGADALQYW